MRVLLRDCQTGFYYAGPRHWVPDPYRAVDLGQVERAMQLEKRAGGETEIVLDYPNPGLRSQYRPLSATQALRDEVEPGLSNRRLSECPRRRAAHLSR